MSKKTPLPPPVLTTISNNVFTGVHFDGLTIEVLNKTAQGLLNITELFKAQNIHLDAMIKVDRDGPKYGSTPT